MRGWIRPDINLRPAEIEDCEILSEIHSAVFRRGWSGAEFEALLLQPGMQGRIGEYRSTFGARVRGGFSLYRLVTDEAELLSLAVLPQCRRRGVALRLMEEMLRDLYRQGARSIHLEVEDTNQAAIALYSRLEFRESGRRPGYYAQGRPKPAGALVMLRQLR
jgi:ribosomal-protein-alanine N-acetyltransferase